jgi:hypothetical protein
MEASPTNIRDHLTASEGNSARCIPTQPHLAHLSGLGTHYYFKLCTANQIHRVCQIPSMIFDPSSIRRRQKTQHRGRTAVTTGKLNFVKFYISLDARFLPFWVSFPRFTVTFQYAPHPILAPTLSLLFSLNISAPHSTNTAPAPVLVASLFHSALHSRRKHSAQGSAACHIYTL